MTGVTLEHMHYRVHYMNTTMLKGTAISSRQNAAMNTGKYWNSKQLKISLS